MARPIREGYRTRRLNFRVMTEPIGPGLRTLQKTLELDDEEIASLAVRYSNDELIGPAAFASEIIQELTRPELSRSLGKVDAVKFKSKVQELLSKSKWTLLANGPAALGALLDAEVIILQKQLRDWGLGR